MFSRVDSFYRAVIARGSGGRALRSRTGFHVTETQSQTVPVGCRCSRILWLSPGSLAHAFASRLYSCTTGRDTEDLGTQTTEDAAGSRFSDLLLDFSGSEFGCRVPGSRVGPSPRAPVARRGATWRRSHDRHPCDTEIRTPHVRFIFCAQTTTWGYIAPADSRLQRSDLRTPFSGVRRERGGGGRARRVSVRTRPNHAKFGRIEQ